MIQVTISGNTPAEIGAEAATLAALLSGTSVKTAEVLSASEQSRLRADATVVPPKDKAKTAAEKKAEKEAAKAAAEAAKQAEAEASDDDALEESTADDDALDEGEALTHDDVKKLLIEVRTAYPKEATIVSQIVQEKGKAKKISEVADKLLPAVAAHCRELLKKAKK